MFLVSRSFIPTHNSSLGRLGLLIHSTAGYVDPGWKGNLTLELSNVANLPIALYFGMRIGQISFFRMSSPVERPYGSQGARVQVPGPVGAHGVGVPRATSRPGDGPPSRAGTAERRAWPSTTRVDWRADLGGGVTVASSRPARSGPTPARSSGPCRGSCGTGSSPTRSIAEHRLLQALNCLLVETPAGRVLVETGIGERVDDKTRAMRGYLGPADPPGAARRPASTRRRSTSWP